MKRAQTSVVFAAVLVILCIALVLMSIVWLLLKPEMKLYSKPQIQEQKQKISEKTYTSEFTCPSPYIKVGESCCLDSNYNSICDKDEEYQKTAKEENVLTCEYPYIKIGTVCCLDSNRNRRCDYDDDYYDQYNSDYNNGDYRFDASLNSPFSLYDYGIRSDEITLWIKNKESYTVTIKSIEIEDCDENTDEVVLEKNDKEKFDFDCERDYNFDRDITIEYLKEGSNETRTSHGFISRDDRYYDY